MCLNLLLGRMASAGLDTKTSRVDIEAVRYWDKGEVIYWCLHIHQSLGR